MASSKDNSNLVAPEPGADLRHIQDEIADGFRGSAARHNVSSLRQDRDADDAKLDGRLTSASSDPSAAGAALLAALNL
jgi:hypothetical protein